MAFDVTTWMPPGMDQTAKDYWAAQHPNDPHMAAAAAWESWAASNPEDIASGTGVGVKSVSTGAQSVTYDGPRTVFAQSMERARWHRARARATSVDVGPQYAAEWRSGERDEVTYDSPPMPPTLPGQVNLP